MRFSTHERTGVGFGNQAENLSLFSRFFSLGFSANSLIFFLKNPWDLDGKGWPAICLGISIYRNPDLIAIIR